MPIRSIYILMFVCFQFITKFLICLSPIVDLFLLISFAPPQKTTTSYLFKQFISLLASCVIASSLDPGITIPETLKVSPRLLDTSAAHPLAWLSPMMITAPVFSP